MESRWDSQMAGLVSSHIVHSRVEDGGQHHFIFQRRPGGRGDWFKRLQRIGNDAAANDNLIGCAHKISGWPRKGVFEFDPAAAAMSAGQASRLSPFFKNSYTGMFIDSLMRWTA